MRIGRKKIVRRGVQIGEITTSPAGDEDLLSYSIRALEQKNAAPAFSGFDRTHQASRTRPENDDVKWLGQ
jgi:hypothetical protein